MRFGPLRPVTSAGSEGTLLVAVRITRLGREPGVSTGIARRSPLSVTIAVSTTDRTHVRPVGQLLTSRLGEKVKTYVRKARRPRDHSHPRRHHPAVRREEASRHGALARQV